MTGQMGKGHAARLLRERCGSRRNFFAGGVTLFCVLLLVFSASKRLDSLLERGTYRAVGAHILPSQSKAATFFDNGGAIPRKDWSRESEPVVRLSNGATSGALKRCNLGSQSGNKTFCCGHRGARASAPENTLASFWAAVNVGANCLEMDVHLTADGELVVMHERTMREKYLKRGEVSVSKDDQGGVWVRKGVRGKQRVCSRSRHKGGQTSGKNFAPLGTKKDERVDKDWVPMRSSSSLSGKPKTFNKTSWNLQAERVHHPLVPAKVEDLTLEEIKSLDAGAWFGPEFAGTQVPTLSEVLDSFWGEELILMVELKAEARCDDTRNGSSLPEGDQYWDISASSKAVKKTPADFQCRSQAFEQRFVDSVIDLVGSFRRPRGPSASRAGGQLRIVFASFNHRLVDQLTLRLWRGPDGGIPSPIQGEVVKRKGWRQLQFVVHNNVRRCLVEAKSEKGIFGGRLCCQQDC